MRPVTIKILLGSLASVSVALAFSPSAALGAWTPFSGTTGQITRAEAAPDWTRGSIAGSASDLPPVTHHIGSARAYVVPHGTDCPVDEFPNPGVATLAW